jgi:hypothetical protein
MNTFTFFTHPDPECSGSSLSSKREGEEGESIILFIDIKLNY